MAVNTVATDDPVYDLVPAETVNVTTIDNDSPGFTVVESSGTTSVSETGTTDTFTLVLNTQPTSDVVLAVASGDTGEVTVSPASVTFTNANWNSAQTVSVIGVDDDQVDGTQTTTLTVAVDAPNSDDTYDPVADQTLSVTTTDDDSGDFTVTESDGNTAVSETGTNDIFTVVLDGQPTSGVVVLTVASGDSGEATVSPASLTFTTANWDTVQTVTVTGVDDSLIDGTQTTTLTVSVDDDNSNDAFDAAADQTVSASTTDDDAAGFTLTESGGTSVNEDGTTDTFTVVLDAQPASDVVLTVTSADTDEATVSPGSLTFTNGNWNTAQTVTVTGVDDPLIDGTQTTTLTVAVDDAASDNDFDPLPNQTVSVSTGDNDGPGFTVAESGGGTSVSEAGTTDSFTVVLRAQPATDVVLTVTSADSGEATVGPTTLTFTNANWDSPQTVTVTGADDPLIDGTQTTTVTVAVDDDDSDDDYDAVADKTVSVSTTDDDSADVTVAESGGSTSVSETGTTDTFTVVLDGQPTSDVVLTVASGDTGEATVSPASLTFTPATWDSPQTVTVTGVDDDLVDGTQTTTLTVAVDADTSDDVFDAVADQTVSVSTDDDESAGVTITESGSTSVSEAGTTDTFTVVLDGQPTIDVVLTVSSGDTDEASVSPASLTFTPATWDSAQTVTVTGVDDDLIDGTQTTTLTVSVDDANSDDAFDAVADQTVSVTTTDDDSAGFTVVESGSTSVDETGTTDTFTVVLDAQPTSDVVLTVASGDTGEATVSPGSLTFTTANWNTPQTVTVTGVDDLLVDGTQTTTLTVSVDDGASDDDFDPLADQTLSVTIADDDSPGFTVVESDGSTSVSETGTTDGFTIVLFTQPATDVVLTFASGDTGEAAVSPAALTFTPANWDSAQTVTVTGVDDALVDGTQTTTVTVSVDDGASDTAYLGVADQTVSVSTTDDDTAGFTVTESGSTAVSEAGSTDTFTVALDGQPTSDVVLTVASEDTGEATVSPTSLTFTTQNWNSAQTVTVTGIDDDLIDGTQTTTVTVSVDDDNSHDAFDPLADQTVGVTTTDDDSAGFTVAESGGSTSVSETGTTDTFTVVLQAQPTSDVVLTVASADTDEATVSPAALTFTPASWNSAQTVTVTGVDDPLVDGTQTTTLTVSVDDANSDDAFDPLANQTLSVSTTDDDGSGFTVTELGGSTAVSETGTTDSFTVVLGTQPSSNVVLRVASEDTGEATVSPASLTFTPSNWSSAQTVTVTGVDDSVVDGTQTTTVTVSVDDANSDDAWDAAPDQTVRVSTVDDDGPGFTVAEVGGSTAVSETGTTDTFTVVLDGRPSTDVVLTVASGDTGEATVSPASLRFTPANWNSLQTVTVTGVDDTLMDGTQTTIVTVSVDDANSDDAFDTLADQTVRVSTVDDDGTGFTVAESGGSTAVSETGTTDTFTVVLDSQPRTNVVLTVASGDTGEATVSPAALTFTNANWNSAQTVTVTGVDDTLVDGTQTTTVTVSVDVGNSDDDFDLLADQTVSVSTTDDDVADRPGFTVAESGGSTSVSETGTTDTFTVVLDARPDSNVVLTVTSADTGESTVSPAALTFTTASWNSAQTVTVTGVDDTLVDGTQTTTVTVSVDDTNSDDAFDPLPDQAVSVSTTDDDVAPDAPGFTVAESGGSTAVSETGTTDTFTVVLDAQPNSDVVLTIGSNDTGEATVGPATLTFTPASWNGAQTVTVTGVDDTLVDGTQTTTLTVSVDDANSDDAFDPLPDQAVSVSTTDDDVAPDAPGFTVAESGGSTSVSETGTTDTFTVVLDARPDSNVVLTVTSADTGEATVSPASLTFTTASWNSAQTVTVTGVDDTLNDGTQTTIVTVSVDDANSDDAFGALADQTVRVFTTEPVRTPDLSLSKTHTGTLTQGAKGVSYTLFVTNDGSGPSNGAVTVTDVFPDGLTPVGVSGAGWDCAIDGQRVECTRSDGLDPGSSYAAIDLTVDVALTAPRTITNEAQLEGGGDVTPDNNEASDVADVGETRAEIAFTKTHIGDFVRGQLEAEFVLLVSNIGNGPASGSTRIVDVLPDALTVKDAGGDGWQCDVAGQVVTCTRGDELPALASFPPLSITVFVPSDAPDSVVNAATLSGTIVDQDIVAVTPPVDIIDPVPVDMQVTKAVDESILRIGDEPTFTLDVGNPSRFVLGGVSLRDTVPPGFIFVPGSGVMRTSGPRSSTLAPALGGKGRENDLEGPRSTVTTSIEPVFVDGDLLFSIGQLTPESRVEIAYLTAVGPSTRPGTFETTVVGTAVSPLGERVTTVPVELQVVVSGSSFSLTQLLIGRVFEDTNQSGTFDAGEPGIANVRVVTASGLSATTDAFGQYNLLAAGSTLVAVDPSTIPDGLSLPDGESRLSGAGRLMRTPLQGGSLLRQNFGLVGSSSSVVPAVRLAPSDVAPLVPSDVVPLAPSDVVVSETGTTDTFTVMLSAQPTTDVVMTVASGDTGEATVRPSSVTFTTANWNSPQTVTVTGVGDSLIDGTQTTPITVSVDAAKSDDGFDQLPDQTFNVSTTDEDSAGFTVTDSRNPSVSETETTDTLTLVLDAQPATDVVLTVASGDTGEATVGPASLTFTPANWHTGQAVTVTGVDDTLVDGTQMTTFIVSVEHCP